MLRGESDRIPHRTIVGSRGASIRMRKQRQRRVTSDFAHLSKRRACSFVAPAFLHKAVSIDGLMASAEGAAPPDGGMRFNTVGAALDERFYQLDDIEATFVSDLTGISDPAELKKHILQVQHEVYAVSTLNNNSTLQDSGSHARKKKD